MTSRNSLHIDSLAELDLRRTRRFERFVMVALWVIFVFKLLAGCTVKGDLGEDEWHGAIRDCVDLRDGERWSFDPKTIRDVRMGFGGPPAVALTYTDTSGRIHTYNSNQESYIKCVPRVKN